MTRMRPLSIASSTPTCGARWEAGGGRRRWSFARRSDSAGAVDSAATQEGPESRRGAVYGVLPCPNPKESTRAITWKVRASFSLSSMKLGSQALSMLAGSTSTTSSTSCDGRVGGWVGELWVVGSSENFLAGSCEN